MIHILFTAGSFGSTIEYIVRRFSKEFELEDANILPDGSMHTFQKAYHAQSSYDIQQLKSQQSSVSSILYPNKDLLSADVISLVKSNIEATHKVVFISCPTIQDYTLVTLCTFAKTNVGNDIVKYLNGNAHRWNSNYCSVDDMKRWEKRELMSLTLFDIMNQIINCADQVLPNWFTLSPSDIVADIYGASIKILNYLDFTIVDHEQLQKFTQQWIIAQQSYINQSELINLITNKIINKEQFVWRQLLFIEEVLLQCQLLYFGYNIHCNDLDEFPTDAVTFNKLISPA